MFEIRWCPTFLLSHRFLAVRPIHLRGQRGPVPADLSQPFLETAMTADALAPTTPGSRTAARLVGRPRIRTKTLAAVGVTAAVAVGVGVMGISALGSTAAATQVLYEGNVGAITATSDHGRRRRHHAARVPQRHPRARRAEGKQAVVDQFPDLQAAWEAGVDAYRAAGPTGEQATLIEEADNAYDTYLSAVEDKLVPLACANDYAGWFAANKAEVAAAGRPGRRGARQLTGMERDEAAASARRGPGRLRVAAHARPSCVLVVGIALALGIGLAVARGDRPRRRPGAGGRRGARRRRPDQDAAACAPRTSSAGWAQPWTPRSTSLREVLSRGGRVGRRRRRVVGGAVGVLGADLGLGRGDLAQSGVVSTRRRGGLAQRADRRRRRRGDGRLDPGDRHRTPRRPARSPPAP